MKSIKRSIAEKLTRRLGNEALREERKAQVGKLKVGDEVVPDAPIDGLPLDRPTEDLEPGQVYTVIDVKEDPKEDKIKVDAKPSRWYSEWSFSRPYGVSVMAKKEITSQYRYQDGLPKGSVSDKVAQSLVKKAKTVLGSIRQKGSEWCAYSEKGRSFGCYPTKGEAEKRLQQMEMFKSIKKGQLDISKDRTVQQIIDDIKSGKDEAFGYAHFDVSNMADYGLMSDTINDMVAVYNINEVQAADIVQALTHEHKKFYKAQQAGETAGHWRNTIRLDEKSIEEWKEDLRIVKEDGRMKDVKEWEKDIEGAKKNIERSKEKLAEIESNKAKKVSQEELPGSLEAASEELAGLVHRAKNGERKAQRLLTKIFRDSWELVVRKYEHSSDSNLEVWLNKGLNELNNINQAKADKSVLSQRIAKRLAQIGPIGTLPGEGNIVADGEPPEDLKDNEAICGSCGRILDITSENCYYSNKQDRWFHKKCPGYSEVEYGRKRKAVEHLKVGDKVKIDLEEASGTYLAIEEAANPGKIYVVDKVMRNKYNAYIVLIKGLPHNWNEFHFDKVASEI